MVEDENRRSPDATEVLSAGEADPAERAHPAELAEAELAEAATRVLPENAAPFARADEGDHRATVREEESEVPATRVLDAEDKTAPPPAVERVRPAPAASPSPRPEPADRGLEPGTILFGEYEIVSVLGAGGMGEVYRARHRRLDEHRAIKVMHAELSKRKGASEFFYREAKALLAVRHPAVVHCHDLLSDDSGRVYLIMEMIEGIPLSQKLAHGPLPPDDVAVLGARVAHGLAAAHRKGVIHRDLSPDNIVLPGGRVQEAKLIDFGIAKLLEQGEGTIVDGFKGKLTYASPEQLGFFGGRIDGRSDLYSLGLVLVAAALGRAMPMGTTVMEAVDARRSLTSLPDGIPVGLRSAILPLLALDPDERPRYVDRLFVAPGAIDAGGESSSLPPAANVGRSHSVGSPSAAGRGSRALVAGAAGAALALAGALFMLLGPSEPESERAASPSAAVDEAAGGAEGEVAPGRAVGESASAARAAAEATGATEGAGAAGAAEAGAAADARVAERPVEQAASPAEPRPTAAVVQPAKAAPVAPAAQPAARKSGPSAKDRVRIVGLLTSAKLALGEDHLVSPPGDNAYEKYRAALALDSANAAARSGLRDVAARLVGRAEEALARGDAAAAREALRQARQADPSLSSIRTLEQRLSGASN